MNEVIKHIRNVFIDRAINPEASFTKSMNRMSITSLKEKKTCYTDTETITKKQKVINNNEKVMNNNNEVINNNDKVMNNNEKVMNSYIYKVVPAEKEGCCYGCCFWSNNDGCLVLPDSTIDCKDGIIKKVPYTTENKKDDSISESIENELDYEYVKVPEIKYGTCRGCCFFKAGEPCGHPDKHNMRCDGSIFKKKYIYKEENKKDDKVMNIFDYKLIEGDGTCNGCCFDDGDKGCRFYDYVKDMGDDIIDNWSCGTSNIYIKVPKQTQLKYATNQGNVSATMDLLPPYDNLELEKVGITDNNQLTIYWKEKHEYLPDWNDLLNNKDINTYINGATQTVPMAVTDKHNKSMVAFAKISQLMPYYGGEADMSSSGYIVIYNKDKDSMNVHQISSVALRKCIFPVFKTKESAQKFILKPDNVQLIKDLYMI